jgi:hypothetical protein
MHGNQHCKRFLWTSGGLLDLRKCAFYILASTFDEEEGQVNRIPKQDIPDLRLAPGVTPGSERVKQLNFDELHQCLGHRLSTNMEMASAYTAL